jgi:hypothetical protein
LDVEDGRQLFVILTGPELPAVGNLHQAHGYADRVIQSLYMPVEDCLDAEFPSGGDRILTRRVKPPHGGQRPHGQRVNLTPLLLVVRSRHRQPSAVPLPLKAGAL